MPNPTPAPSKPIPAAIPMGPDAAAHEAKKKMLNMVIIVVILFFGGAGLWLARGAFTNDDGGGGGSFVTAPGKPVWETPREPLPMGPYTLQIFGKAKPIVQTDKGGGRRGQQYYLYSPRGADGGVKYPLVVFLHDEKGMADGAMTLLQKQMRQALPAYVLVPMTQAKKTWAVPAKYHGQEFTGKSKGLPAAWSTKRYPVSMQTLNDVMNLTASLLSKIPTIDDGRVYVVGCGEGALGVYGILANYSEFFAGGVAVSGHWSYLDAGKLKDSPLLIMHGGKDTTVPALHAQSIGQVIQQMGGTKVIYQEIPDLARNCADPRLFTPTVWKWLFSNKKPSLAPAIPQDLQPEGYLEMQKPPSPVAGRATAPAPVSNPAPVQ